jgi:hypothetical protein
MELKTKKVTTFIVDSDDFDRFVESKYGGSCEIIAVDEANNNSFIKFTVGGKNYTLADEELEAKIRGGNYPTYSTHHIIKCLIEDGHLTEEGEYTIEICW